MSINAVPSLAMAGGQSHAFASPLSTLINFVETLPSARKADGEDAPWIQAAASIVCWLPWGTTARKPLCSQQDFIAVRSNSSENGKPIIATGTVAKTEP